MCSTVCNPTRSKSISVQLEATSAQFTPVQVSPSETVGSAPRNKQILAGYLHFKACVASRRSRLFPMNPFMLSLYIWGGGGRRGSAWQPSVPRAHVGLCCCWMAIYQLSRQTLHYLLHLLNRGSHKGLDNAAGCPFSRRGTKISHWSSSLVWVVQQARRQWSESISR